MRRLAKSGNLTLKGWANLMFISLEGIEGCGKTTQIRQLSQYFEEQGYPYMVTRQPGGTAIGEKIRSILLDPACKDMDPTAELLLYMADRAQHINELIKPSLDQGKYVLCDRYFDATVVYQGFARGLDIQFILDLHRIIFQDLKPDLTLLLDLPPTIGLARAWHELDSGGRSGTESRFEEETINFHEKVRQGYLKLARLEPERFKIIDASGKIDQVQSDIRAVLIPYLEE
jgi:dTMP kinase